MAYIVPDEIDAYAEEHTTPPDALLGELAQETRETMALPQMLTGAVEGRFLELLVRSAGARRVLEIGTFTGYSALSMAAGLSADGVVETCEVSEEHAAVARRYFERSPHGSKIRLHIGPALDSIAALDGEFDFVFVDADKENYRNYYEAVLPRLSRGALIAFDNTLWSGRVASDEDQSEATRALRELNDLLAADERVVCVLLTVRDGITLAQRRDTTSNA